MQACITLLTLSAVAAADASQYRAINAAGTVPAAGARSAGFTTMAAAAGTRVPYAAVGTALATAGGAIAVDALVEIGANGKVVTKGSGVAVARALSAAAADGDVIELLLIPN